MFLLMRSKTKYISGLVLVMLFMSLQPARAAGPPAPSIMSNTLTVMLFVLMILLAIIIGILGSVLIGAADYKLKKRKTAKMTPAANVVITIFFLLLQGSSAFAQVTTETSKAVSNNIGGMPVSTFYLMATVIFIELLLIIVMLLNIRILIKKEKEKLIVISDADAIEAKRTRLSWWAKMNKLRPVSQEAELDLGHDYDGIRELNNKLPPWWLYGFYLTIIVSGIYLWRFHISHEGKSSKEEYEYSVAKADLQIKEFLKTKGEAVDENTVTLLTAAVDLSEGKSVYLKSCATCHTETGAGNVGPNLTDNFWMHGNDIKSIFKTIRYGINAMPQWQNSYSNKQIAQVSSYVKSLYGSNPPNGKAPQGIEMKEEAVLDSTINKDGKIALNK